MENKLRTIAEYQFFKELIEEHPKGILSLVSDTFDLFTVITEFLPRLKSRIMARDGKLVIRPDSGDPVDIICGTLTPYDSATGEDYHKSYIVREKGVIELLWDIFGGTINEQGYKVLDPHIGAIYGDSITLDRQIQIYERLEAKGFATTNIVLGIGSYTYQMNTRDTLGFAAKGGLAIIDGIEYPIYKDPITDDGTKKSHKGYLKVDLIKGEYEVKTNCTKEEEEEGFLHTIYENGKFYNQNSLTEIRKSIDSISNL